MQRGDEVRAHSILCVKARENAHVLPVPSPRMKSPPCTESHKHKPTSRTKISFADTKRNLNHEVLDYSVE